MVCFMTKNKLLVLVIELQSNTFIVSQTHEIDTRGSPSLNGEPLIDTLRTKNKDKPNKLLLSSGISSSILIFM